MCLPHFIIWFYRCSYGEEMKFVVAGNHEQFQNWCYETKTKPREAIYVDSPEKLFGMRLKAEDVFRYGTYYERPDLDQIEQMIRERLEK